MIVFSQALILTGLSLATIIGLEQKTWFLFHISLLAFSLLLAVSIGFNLYVLLSRFFKRKSGDNPEKLNDNDAVPPLAVLRDESDQISQLLTQSCSYAKSADSRLNAFQSRLNQYAVSTWQTAEQSQNMCLKILRDLVLLLDHLEIFQRKVRAKYVTSLIRRIEEILLDARVEEISPDEGTGFNGARHKIVGQRKDESSTGAVLEVTRKGYMLTIKEKSNVILRPAEVIISSNQVSRKQQITQEDEK